VLDIVILLLSVNETQCLPERCVRSSNADDAEQEAPQDEIQPDNHELYEAKVYMWRDSH
jgi:hypothetical protein